MFGAAQLKILLMSCQIVNITYYWPAIVHCEYEYASASCLFYNPHITLIYLYPAKAGVSHLQLARIRMALPFLSISKPRLHQI